MVTEPKQIVKIVEILVRVTKNPIIITPVLTPTPTLPPISLPMKN